MSNFKRIVIFTIHPINNDYLRRYGEDYFKNNNIEVIFINVCILFYGMEKTKRAGYDSINKCNSINEISISSYKELHSYLRSFQSNTVIYLNITPSPKLLALIWKLGIPYIAGSLWGGVQEKDWTLGYKAITNRYLKKFLKNPKTQLIQIKKKLESLLSKLIISIYPPLLTLIKDFETVLLNKKENILLNHTFDYDRYLMNKELNKPAYIPNTKYHVFLPNHAWKIHDYIINDAEDDSVITKEIYSDLINKTLDNIEKLTKIKIIVAGYPNATKEEDIYHNREFLLESETEQLVKYSSGVITHFTGAINFAVLHSKPVCLINYKIFDGDPRFSNSIKSYAFNLDTPINYVDEDKQVEDLVANGLFSIDIEAYKAYVHKFICDEELKRQGDKLFWERVINKLN